MPSMHLAFVEPAPIAIAALGDQPSLWISAFSALIAALAFIRPEIANSLKRWFNQIDYFPRGRVQVGFSSWGPTIAITGTILAIRNDQVVRDMLIRVVRKRDQKSHHLVWGTFRNQKLILSGASYGESAEAELATSFAVIKGDARKIDIQFIDLDTRDRYLERLTAVKEAWNDAKINDVQIRQMIIENNYFGAVTYFTQEHAQTIYEFTKAVERECYWDEGEYDIDLSIITSRPTKKFIFSGSFILTQKEAESLRKNPSRMVLELCDLSHIQYEFDWPKTNWSHMDSDVVP